MDMSIGVNLRVTAHSCQGGRKYMEDMLSVAYQPTVDEKDLHYAYFGIFDGHGGKEAALYTKEHLMDNIVSQKNFWSNEDEYVLKAIHDGFVHTHYAMRKELDSWPKTPSGLPSTSGTTASIAFVRRSKIYIGHVGDSGLILGYQDAQSGYWKAKPLTRDHKPESTDENARITQCGGKVVRKSGVPRVVWNRPRLGHKGPVRRSTQIDEIPFLAVARSLGDFWSYNSNQNEFVVSPEPDVSVVNIDVSSFRCLIFASDGLWNMLNPQEAVNSVYFAEKHNERQLLASPPDTTTSQLKSWMNPSKRLVDRALDRWFHFSLRADNTSVVTVVIDPPGPPKSQVLRSSLKSPIPQHKSPSSGESNRNPSKALGAMLSSPQNSDDSPSVTRGVTKRVSTPPSGRLMVMSAYVQHPSAASANAMHIPTKVERSLESNLAFPSSSGASTKGAFVAPTGGVPPRKFTPSPDLTLRPPVIVSGTKNIVWKEPKKMRTLASRGVSQTPISTSNVANGTVENIGNKESEQMTQQQPLSQPTKTKRILERKESTSKKAKAAAVTDEVGVAPPSTTTRDVSDLVHSPSSQPSTSVEYGESRGMPLSTSKSSKAKRFKREPCVVSMELVGPRRTRQSNCLPQKVKTVSEEQDLGTNETVAMKIPKAFPRKKSKPPPVAVRPEAIIKISIERLESPTRGRKKRGEGDNKLVVLKSVPSKMKLSSSSRREGSTTNLFPLVKRQLRSAAHVTSVSFPILKATVVSLALGLKGEKQTDTQRTPMIVEKKLVAKTKKWKSSISKQEGLKSGRSNIKLEPPIRRVTRSMMKRQ